MPSDTLVECDHLRIRICRTPCVMSVWLRYRRKGGALGQCIGVVSEVDVGARERLGQDGGGCESRQEDS